MINLLLFQSSLSFFGYEIKGNFTNTEDKIVSFGNYKEKLLLVDATPTCYTACGIHLKYLRGVFERGLVVNVPTLNIDPRDTITKVAELKGRFSSPWTFGLNYNKDFI